MSMDFEYISRVTIGQYLPVESPIHRLDPRAKLLAYVLLLGAITFTTRIEGVAFGLFVLILCLYVGRIPLRFALRGLIPPLPFLLFLAVLQAFFYPLQTHGPLLLHWGPVNLSTASLWSGATLILRFGALFLGISLATFTLSTSEMIHGLRALLYPLQKIGLPSQDLVMMIQVTLHFLPFLAQAAERIVKAQASRGADWDTRRGGLMGRVRLVIPLIVPLFLTSLRRAENLAIAMEARGYAASSIPTTMEVIHWEAKDSLAVFLSAGLAFLIVIL